jgi:hypothetical protein
MFTNEIEPGTYNLIVKKKHPSYIKKGMICSATLKLREY